ncbi:hypothetical protein V5O48_018351 [Marasmius crinis-equi]|uniref:CCHC-type domain-containing protein n=1 Tax=Marasmius crinis-equi TaxID=585013 RepID=A0ABR3ELE9_9AGAR
MADLRVFSPLMMQVPKLEGETNWHPWKKDMQMVFNADGETWDIVTGVTNPGTDTAELRSHRKKDTVAFSVIRSLLSPSIRSIVDELSTSSGSTAFATLKAKYEGTTWSRRITLRKVLHSVTHDPSKPIDVYISAMKTACQQLTDIGVDVDDTYYKDLLLSNLHKDYIQVRTTLLASATGEPTLQTVTSTLSSSGPIIRFDPDAPVIKQEPMDTALALSRFDEIGSRPQSYRPRAKSGSGKSGSGALQAHGRHWGSMENEGCHRCGTLGHKALWCIMDMPDDVKKWCLNRKEERSHFADSDEEVTNVVRDESSSFAYVSSASGFRSQSPLHLDSSDAWERAYNTFEYVDTL